MTLIFVMMKWHVALTFIMIVTYDLDICANEVTRDLDICDDRVIYDLDICDDRVPCDICVYVTG